MEYEWVWKYVLPIFTLVLGALLRPWIENWFHPKQAMTDAITPDKKDVLLELGSRLNLLNNHFRFILKNCERADRQARKGTTSQNLSQILKLEELRNECSNAYALKQLIPSKDQVKTLNALMLINAHIVLYCQLNSYSIKGVEGKYFGSKQFYKAIESAIREYSAEFPKPLASGKDISELVDNLVDDFRMDLGE